jgi:hypothetical protein
MSQRDLESNDLDLRREPSRPRDLVASLEADLASLAAAEADLELDAEIAERTRIERSAIDLRDRLRAARAPVEISSLGGSSHAGRVADVGLDWVLLHHVARGQHVMTAEHLVLLGPVLAVRGLGRAVIATPGALADRPVRSVLRGWCRDRSDVSVLLVDGSVIAGLASATFGDHLELSTGGGATVVVPFHAMAVVSR